MNKIINGFEIIQDFGVIYTSPGINRNKTHFVLVICKHCKKEWKTSYYTLSKINGCGCTRPSQLIKLDDFVNGFRIIKDFGYEKSKLYRWALVECKVCHREYEVDPNKLRYRNHCGCMKKDQIASRYAKEHPQLTQAFKHMKSRCYNINNRDYYNYGGRGVTICDEWLKDRNVFIEWSLKNGFESDSELSIDRIDSNKSYSPDNCRWTDAKGQGRNTRRVKISLNKAIEIRKAYKDDPARQNIINLAKDYGVSIGTIYLIIQYKTWKE